MKIENTIGMRSTINAFLIFLSLAFLLITCKQKEVVPASLTLLKFELQDDFDQSVSGARVFLFNSLADWQVSKIQRRPINASDSTFSTDGFAKIEVDPKNDYYLLVIYKDPQRSITLLNVSYDSLITKLPPNVDITVRVKLEAVDGNLGFYSLDQVVSPITITMKMENQAQSFRLDSRRDNEPLFASEGNQIAVNLPPGTYTYKANNANGCTWAGRQELTVGGFNKIALSGCSSGNVVFYSDNSNALQFPISIRINEDNEVIGSVNNPLANYSCGDPFSPALVTTNLAAGRYSYSAVAGSKCLWTGSFQVQSNQTCATIVKLNTCN